MVTRFFVRFQSTLPVGGATGCDFCHVKDMQDFNPRSPWGERLDPSTVGQYTGLFQSTLPVGGATTFPGNGQVLTWISIHAPRGGSDRISSIGKPTCHNFNPRSPWGERPETIAAPAEQ